MLKRAAAVIFCVAIALAAFWWFASMLVAR
jgi:hypothetical protein